MGALPFRLSQWDTAQTASPFFSETHGGPPNWRLLFHDDVMDIWGLSASLRAEMDAA